MIDKRLGELLQNPDNAYGAETTKYSLEDAHDDDGQRKLITRLADDRRGTFAHAEDEEIFGGPEHEITFGPARAAQELFFRDKDGIHAFVIPQQLLDRAIRTLEKYPAELVNREPFVHPETGMIFGSEF